MILVRAEMLEKICGNRRRLFIQVKKTNVTRISRIKVAAQVQKNAAQVQRKTVKCLLNQKLFH